MGLGAHEMTVAQIDHAGMIVAVDREGGSPGAGVGGAAVPSAPRDRAGASGRGPAPRPAALGIGVHRIAEQRGAGRHLHDPAAAHHHDPVGDVVDHREVVADEEIGQAQLVLQVLQQVEDLGLDRDVQRRDRLVADQQVGPQRQRPGDADALALAAGEAVRVALQVADVEADQRSSAP